MKALITIGIGDAKMGIATEGFGKLIGSAFSFGRKSIHKTASKLATKTAPRKRKR